MKTLMLSVIFIAAVCLTGCSENPQLVSWEEAAPGTLPPTQEELDAGVTPGTFQVDPL